MSSEDDMQDALCETSEDFDSDRMPTDDDDGDDDQSDYAFDYNGADDDQQPTYHRRQLLYTVLNEKDIERRQEDAICIVAAVLSISRAQAVLLLRNFEWCVSRVNDEWFADEARVRKHVGLLDKHENRHVEKRHDIRELKCGICLDYHPTEKMQAAVCSHYFCNSCWSGYIHTSINDGPGCLSLHCPNPDCTGAVGEDLALPLVSEDDKAKYRRYVLRSFVEDNREVKWCPAPGCEYAVELTPGSGLYDVYCNCGHNFCWNCLEEAHRPVECATVDQWILKNSEESENMNWILANSKPCPKCKRPIEKNQGCMHVTCTPPCKYEFCWLCLAAWSEHGERTGGFYACNRYEAEKKEGKHDETERRREMAKNSLERYTHYYERWASNESSRAKALSDLKQMQAVQMEILSDKQCQPVSQLKFITEAWLQIVECRRVLKWTYAYGYYLPEHELAKKQFFEYLQGEAEAWLERLHQCAEREIQGQFEEESTEEVSFNVFRTKLAGLTSVTRNYFENLVRALENGLADVHSFRVAGSKTKPQVSTRGSTSRLRGASSSRIGSSSKVVSDNGHWYCEHCTYANTEAASVCAMCRLANL